MARDRQTGTAPDSSDVGDPSVDPDAAAAAERMTGLIGGHPPDEGQPEHVGQGRTLITTRIGYEFHGSTVDVPITSTGVYVTKEQAQEIQDEAAAHGEIVFINQEG